MPLLASRKKCRPLSTALLFWLGEGGSGGLLETGGGGVGGFGGGGVVATGVVGTGVGVGVGVGLGEAVVPLVALLLWRLVGASSSASVSSMRGMCGSESSMRNSGWVMKLWMDVRDSGFSSPSYGHRLLRNAFTTRICGEDNPKSLSC